MAYELAKMVIALFCDEAPEALRFSRPPHSTPGRACAAVSSPPPVLSSEQAARPTVVRAASPKRAPVRLRSTESPWFVRRAPHRASTWRLSRVVGYPPTVRRGENLRLGCEQPREQR